MSLSRNHIAWSAVLLLFVFLITACDDKRVYEEWLDVPSMQWSADSTQHFVFSIEDTTSLYNMNFGVRHMNTYPYQNLWLIAHFTGPDDFNYQDTIQLVLANKTGSWYGKRSAGLYTYVAPVYRHLPFLKAGEYRFELTHGMREEELAGLAAIGFRVEKADLKSE